MRRGITLLEVLVAAVILSVGLLGVLEAVGRSAATSARVQDRARALMFARSKMDEILKEPTLQSGTDQGKGVDESTDYDWEVDISPSSNQALYTILVSVTNRITKYSTGISALRRPSLDPSDSSGSAGGSTATTGTTKTGTTGAAGGTTR